MFFVMMQWNGKWVDFDKSGHWCIIFHTAWESIAKKTLAL